MLVLQAIKAAADTLRRAARGEDGAADDAAESSRLVPVPDPHGTRQLFTARRADALALMAETPLKLARPQLPRWIAGVQNHSKWPWWP